MRSVVGGESGTLNVISTHSIESLDFEGQYGTNSPSHWYIWWTSQHRPQSLHSCSDVWDVHICSQWIPRVSLARQRWLFGLLELMRPRWHSSPSPHSVPAKGDERWWRNPFNTAILICPSCLFNANSKGVGLLAGNVDTVVFFPLVGQLLVSLWF